MTLNGRNVLSVCNVQVPQVGILRKLHTTKDILISWLTWFVISLAVLGVSSLFVCCMIHCKHLLLSDANKLTYLLTYLLKLGVVSKSTFCRRRRFTMLATKVDLDASVDGTLGMF